MKFVSRIAWPVSLAALGVVALVPFATGAAAAAATVPLGTATSFAVLAGAGITNTGPTTVKGDVGTFPTTTVTGSASMTITGVNHAGDAVTQQAKTDLVTAYGNAAGQGPTNPIAADLGGRTLTAGVYNSASTIGLTGALTLNGAGDPNAVFVFQAGSALTTASGSLVNLINGAQSCNVFWQVGSSATLGTGSTFRGTVLALTSITVTTAVTVDGRVLARNGAVTLDTDTITSPVCAAQVPATTTTAVPATTSTTTTAVPATTTSTTSTTVRPTTASTVRPRTSTTVRPRTGAVPASPGFARPVIRHTGFAG
ncbi:MAG: DUF3494 domain-containing protein [Acidobacteria bacterium]|nr:DUF3494 domain-containing protein [Acidobacteriota bacterium]